MIDPTLLIPLLIISLGACVAALFGLPAFNRRLTIAQLSSLLALTPFVAFVLLLLRVPISNTDVVFVWQWSWLPSLGINLGFYVDSLSLFFALIVTFIGALILVYAGQYFKGDQSAWRFLTYLLLFMLSMLGLVMAGDVLTLFIFWEGTSIMSFLLVAYKTKDEAARKGAFRALFITGGGGIALLAGLLFVSSVVGSTEYATILSSGDLLRSSELYGVMLALVAFGALTKSAQWPAHIWLPGAMSAPTPASAYLHSATMVKAGIYLLARMNPALGFTEAWFWLLTLTGGVTMLAGAYLGLKQNDMKALLAYSTISQLGVLVMLIGQDVSGAYKALIIGILAHALYKSALFMAAGIVDHEAGTRDLRRLGGLRKVMPFTFVIMTVAAASMAGLPPLFGFLAKETLLATAVHPSLPPVIGALLPWVSVLAGALLLAQAGLLVWETFMGKPKDPGIHAHEAPWAMWLMPAIPAALSLMVGLLPEPRQEAIFLANAAAAAYGDEVKVSLALWTGLNVPLLLSGIAITLGTILFLFRHRVRDWQARILPGFTFNKLYEWVLAAIDNGGYWATRLQQGKLRTYLVIIIVATILLILIFARFSLFLAPSYLSLPEMNFAGEVFVLRLFSLFLVVGASAATIALGRDFYAVMAFGASGLAMALLFVLEPAPDVALVQIVVDILSLVILVLALTRLPRRQRQRAQELTEHRRAARVSVLCDALVAVSLGFVVMLITLTALVDRPRETAVTPFYAANAKLLTGATDMVGAIVVDFRALDTVIEIAVFSIAGLGIYTLLRFAARKHGDSGQQLDTLPQSSAATATFGIGGAVTSPFIRVPSYAALPLSLVLAVTHMMYGHDQPGDGFTAGVIISLAVGLWYVVFGYYKTRQQLAWLRPAPLISVGVLLAIVTGTIAAFITGSFLGNIDFTAGWAFLPRGFHISTSFLFEVAICLTVLGSITYMLNTLGHPEEEV